MTDRTEREGLRATRQAKVDARVKGLRQQADELEAKSEAMRGAVSPDSAFWTQPAYGNAAGRAFARSRDRERTRIIKAGELLARAKDLRLKADTMEARGAVIAGDAAADRDAKASAVSVAVGQMVDTVHYGRRKVLKVNAKSVLVEGAFGPLKVDRHFIQARPTDAVRSALKEDRP